MCLVCLVCLDIFSPTYDILSRTYHIISRYKDLVYPDYNIAIFISYPILARGRCESAQEPAILYLYKILKKQK